MYLIKIKDKIRNHAYKSRKEFREDYVLIYENCKKYNGEENELTKAAAQMLEVVDKFMASNSEQISKLEKIINPLFNANPITALNLYFLKIVNEDLYNVEKSFPFHNPVSESEAADYKKIISNPMDFQVLKKNCEQSKYKKIAEFVKDVELIYVNSAKYNGLSHAFTETAKKIWDMAKIKCQEEPRLIEIERKINGSQSATGSTNKSAGDANNKLVKDDLAMSESDSN